MKIGSSFPNANRVYVLFFFSSSYNQIVIFLLPSSLSSFWLLELLVAFPSIPNEKARFCFDRDCRPAPMTSQKKPWDAVMLVWVTGVGGGT